MLAEPGNAAAHAWRERDLNVLWHPCTQMREHPHTLPLLPIASGQGPWLIGHDGRRWLDAISSWWTNLFGHAEPRIAAAIAEQARTLEHVILAGVSPPPAVELAERLLAIAPRQAGRAPLAKVFYADNGSAGGEVALKMAFHWFRNRGEDGRTKFVALENGYHGETLGALAVGDVPLYRRVYAPLLIESLFAPSPDAYACEPGQSPAERARQVSARGAPLGAAHQQIERDDGIQRQPRHRAPAVIGDEEDRAVGQRPAAFRAALPVAGAHAGACPPRAAASATSSPLASSSSPRCTRKRQRAAPAGFDADRSGSIGSSSIRAVSPGSSGCRNFTCGRRNPSGSPYCARSACSTRSSTTTPGTSGRPGK